MIQGAEFLGSSNKGTELRSRPCSESGLAAQLPDHPERRNVFRHALERTWWKFLQFKQTTHDTLSRFRDDDAVRFGLSLQACRKIGCGPECGELGLI